MFYLQITTLQICCTFIQACTGLQADIKESQSRLVSEILQCRGNRFDNTLNSSEGL